MSRNIAPIASTDTVEEWFNKTNLLIDAVQDAVTLGDGELNEGNVVLNGGIGALSVSTNQINLTDELLDTLDINARILASSARENPLTLNAIDGGSENGSKISFELSDSKIWEIGTFDNAFATFGIRNETHNYSLTLTTNESNAGTLSGTNVVIDKSLLPTLIDSNTTGSAGTCEKWKTPRLIEFATGDVTGSFTLDGSTPIQNIVLSVKDNSHLHEISNVTGLEDALTAKLDYDAALDSVTNLADKFGILVRTTASKIEPKVLAQGDGISITNGGGVSGNPTIAHADTTQETSSENTAAQFIQNIGIDKFGHISKISSANVPVSRTYVSAEREITGGAKADITHSLGDRPFIVEGFLICSAPEAGYDKGDMIALSSAATTDITVYATKTKIGFRCKNIVDIKVVNDRGQLVSINNNNWKLVVKGVI
jgi:hypothetical protein